MRHAFPCPKTVLLAAFLLLIAAPWASAAPRHGSPQPARISGGIAIPDVLSLAWSFMTGGWMKEGCQIDPGGRYVTALPTKEGCQIDPFGRCVTTSQPKEAVISNRTTTPHWPLPSADNR